MEKGRRLAFNFADITVDNPTPSHTSPEGYFKSITGHWVSSVGKFVSLPPSAFRLTRDGGLEPINPEHIRSVSPNGRGRQRIGGLVRGN